MKTRSDGTTLIAIYHFISGFLSLLGVCGMVSIPLIVGLTAGASGDPDAGTATAITAIMGLLAGGLFLVISAANWIVGWGLWRQREWARVTAIGLAFLRLLNIPLGTLFGGLIIWHLLREEVKAEFCYAVTGAIQTAESQNSKERKAVTQPSITLLAIFAHPDDEIGVGSTLAYYSDAGVRTVLACASRGEAATIYCEDCATHETLAEVRTRELECACQHLGISELRWLDWPDGGIKDLPRPEAVRQIIALIREIQPQVILTHPENGLYPHPDHLAVWEIVREAFTAAADPEMHPEAGAAWAVARLFTRALPQSFFERAPGLAEFRVQLNGQQLPFLGTPDDQIDVVMRRHDMALAPWTARRMAAWDCHRSQHNPTSFTSTMSDDMRQEMAANEGYVLAAARMPLPEGVDDDLLAGLSEEAEPAPEQASAELVAFLRDELAAHRALAEHCQVYQSKQSAAKYIGLFRKLADGEQQIIYRLSRTLRQVGEPAGVIGPAPRLLAAGQHQIKFEEQRRFLQNAFLGAASRLQAGAGVMLTHDTHSTAGAGQQAVWSELVTLVAAQLEALEALSVGVQK